MVQSFGQRIRNQSPLNVHRIFEQIRKGGVFGGAQSGVFIAVLSAVETALWDLAGKALNVPVYQLLGGKFRDRIRVYCDTALYQTRQPTPEQFAQAATKAKNDGYTAIKFDLDQGGDPNKYDQFNWTASPAEIQRMVDQLTAARQAVGPNIDICADMHARYDYPTGQQVAKRVEPLNLMWLEEPVPAENVDAYKLIAAGNQHADLCRREHLSRPRVPAPARDGRAWTSSCPTSRRPVVSGKASGSPTWRTSTTCRLRRTWWRRSSAPWRRATCVPRFRTS